MSKKDQKTVTTIEVYVKGFTRVVGSVFVQVPSEYSADQINELLERNEKKIVESCFKWECLDESDAEDKRREIVDWTQDDDDNEVDLAAITSLEPVVPRNALEWEVVK